MHPETVFDIATWSVGLGLPFAAVWWGTIWIRRTWARNVTRVVLVPAALFLLGDRVREYASRPFSRGLWRCSICQLEEYQMRWRSRCLLSVPTGSPRWPGSFSDWYARRIGSPHQHDWLLPLGRISVGDGGFCSIDPGSSYYSTLPWVPSQEIALSMVNRLSLTPVEHRLDMLAAFEKPREEGNPFDSREKVRSLTREEFEAAYLAWLDRHPEWK